MKLLVSTRAALVAAAAMLVALGGAAIAIQPAEGARAIEVPGDEAEVAPGTLGDGAAAPATNGSFDGPLVPDVASLPVEEAIAALGAVGMTGMVVDAAVRSFSELGLVASQDPPPGTEARAGTAVSLSVGTTVLSSSFLGVPEAEGIELVRQVGFEPVLTYSSANTAAEIGVVVAQDPPPDTALSGNSIITLNVAQPVSMALLGLTEADALAQLVANGMTATWAYQTAATAAEIGLVVGQAPGPGDATVARDTPFELVIAQALSVPDLTSATAADARSAIEGLGLQFATVDVPAVWFEEIGTVRYQDPIAGTALAADGIVTAAVAQRPLPTIVDRATPLAQDWEWINVTEGDTAGECFNGRHDGVGLQLDNVDCATAHDLQLIGLVTVDGPSQWNWEAVRSSLSEQCSLTFAASVGAPQESSSLSTFNVNPGEQNWASGLRTGWCLVHAGLYSGDQLVGDALGSLW